MNYNALSVQQPWATLIAAGVKKYETRSWKTNYRGQLIICSSLHTPKKMLRAALQLKSVQDGISKFWEFGTGISEDFSTPHDEYDLWHGMALCVVDLVDCIPTESLRPIDYESEKDFGDFSPGRFAWKLDNVRQIETFSVTGLQGIFNFELKIRFY